MKKYLYYPLQFLIFTLIFYILSGASLFNTVFPFAFSFMFALVWCNQKPYIVCPAYIAGSLLFDWGFNNIISTICCVFCILVPYYIHYILKKNIKIWEMGTYCFVSQTASVLLSYFSGQPFYFSIISAFLGVLFCYSSICILDAVMIRACGYKLSIIEYISGGIFLAAISSGLAGITIWPFSFFKFFASFAILLIAYVSKSYYAVFAAVIMGFGSLLGLNNPIFIPPLIIWAMSISLFKGYKRYFMPIAIIAAEVLCGFVFKLYYAFSPWEIAPVVAASLIFLLLPNKFFDLFKLLFKNKSSRAAVKDVVNRNREVLTRRLGYLSEVFSDMNRVFRKMAEKSISIDDMKGVMKTEIKKKVCENCPEYQRCYRVYSSQMSQVLDELVGTAFDKGKVTMLDLPNFMTTHCTKAIAVISEVNTLCMQYKRYSDLIGNVDKSKLLIADQLYAVSGVFKNLSKELSAPMSFDFAREEKISQQLSLNEIVCDDIVVYESGIHAHEATLLVRNEDKNKQKIPEIVGKICGSSMTVTETISNSKPGYTTLNLKTAPKYNCSFGLSRKSKTGEEKCGDCHSVLKLDSDKFLFALSDGMGSGKKAEEISETAINLVENFYKAGFDSDLALSSVNKFLSLQKEEAFSAIDIVVVDLKIGVADFIKMGSPESFLVGKESCQVIEGGSLPLGIVSSSAPSMKKITTEAGDYIILLTDGISESFKSSQALSEFICQINDKNPQTVADKIMEAALENNQGRAKDDMTVLVIKIF